MDKIQVIKYKCCGAVFAGCCEPECYIDKEWLKELRKYINEGCSIDMVNKADFKWGKFECDKLPNNNQMSLML